MRKIWKYCTSSPTQRVGLIILSIGLLSYLAWVFAEYRYGYDYRYIDRWVGVIFDPDYYPRNRDFLFFHLYLYLIPIGLLMTCGYKLLVKLKKWVMVGNKKELVNDQILHFKDNEAAFDMACKFMDVNIVQDKPVIAISMQNMKKPSEPIMIKVAGDPPFHARTATHYTGDHLIKKGDLLGVVPFEKSEYVTSYMENDDRKQWLFYVISELNPSFHSRKQMWSIKKNFLMEAVAREKMQSHG